MKYRLFFLFILIISVNLSWAQFPEIKTDLDRNVKTFLEENVENWWVGVPMSDGKVLYDIIIENNYKSAVEIGTSFGHSAIWIGWALSKTGGKLITIEIDTNRYIQAVENFKKAGLADFIDARLGNARELVPALDGKYDFVFSDGDINWTKNYFIILDPKILVGGCFTRHDVEKNFLRRIISGNSRNVTAFVRHVKGKKNYKTTFNRDGNGISISYKTKEK
jgi:predicted O-methyltransferase YrrM